MTDAEHDDALGELGQRILKRLDSQPLILGTPRRQNYKHVSVTIPISAILTEDDLINAIGDVLRDMRLELAEWAK